MRQKGSDEESFFAVAGLYPLLFNAMANPEIGAFRDWDALSFPALPLSLWAACALLRLEIARYEAVSAEGVLSKHGLAMDGRRLPFIVAVTTAMKRRCALLPSG